MKCILLAAGYGTRLYPLTKDTAKPLLPIRGRPIIEHIINKVETVDGIDEIVVVSNHRFYGDFVKWADNCPSRIPIKIVDDGSTNVNDRLGAIRDLALAVEKAEVNDDILIIGGDNIFDFSLTDFISQAFQKKPNTIIGAFNMNGKTQAKKFGMVTLDKNKKVVEFLEKPDKVKPEHLIALCLYFLPKEKLSRLNEYLGHGHDHDAIGNFFKWLAQHDTVYGYSFEGMWLDIGDIDAYTEAVMIF